MGIRRWHGLPPPAKATREAPATIPAYWLGRLLAGPCLRSANIIRAGAFLSTLLDKIVYKILYAKQWQNVYVAKCLYGNGLRVNCNERYATGQIHFFAAKRFGKRDASLVRLMTARRPVPRGRRTQESSIPKRRTRINKAVIPENTAKLNQLNQVANVDG